MPRRELERRPLDVAETLRGKRLLLVGATGFIGKVALSMLLRRYPDVGKLFVLVRPGAGSSSEDRFFDKVVTSPVFDPVREVWGEGWLAFLREKCEPLAGDVARPLLNFGDAELLRLGRLDAIVNCAGLVTFNPTLETALRINVLGPQHVIEVARRTGAGVVHISTCFVAGNRDGEVWEDEPVAGYFPKLGELRDEDFSVDAEIADCQRIIDQVKSRADDRAHVSEFRDRGARRLRDEGRDPDDERALRIAVQRERKMWVQEKLIELGMERAQHWGWPNTYTYTKSLGEQVCAGADDVRTCIVRPSIVESAVRYPFPGWNEGFTTTAPLAFLAIKGHRTYPAGANVTLDLMPVDLVAAGLIMTMAAVIDGSAELVYQLSSGDQNPFPVKRAVELLGLYKRRYFRERTAKGEGHPWVNRALARLEPVPVSRRRFDQTSSPLWKGVADGVSDWISRATPRWGAPRLVAIAEHAKDKLGALSSLAGQTDDLFQLFMPFIYERAYVFRCDHTRALHARLTPADRLALAWDPERIDWRHYWLEIHMRGLEKWVFPSLEEEFEAKPRSVYTYRDLLEMFDTATKHYKNRVAMRYLDGAAAKANKVLSRLPGGDGDAERYSYADLQELALRVAAGLRERGVAPGDRVMLLSENRPEWGITYFGILKAGAQVVPVDSQLSDAEVSNLLAFSGARALVLSDQCAERLAGVGGPSLRVRMGELFEREPQVSPAALMVHPKADELASLIFTSGTTGRPKGVMLSHRNFTSLLSKLAAVFDLDKHDRLLSVLPLHHTFEFTAGLLMPLMRGAQIVYLDEVSADTLRTAFKDGQVTGMVGVPALWQLLHRKIKQQVVDRGLWVERAFDLLVELSRHLRERAPIDLNLGKLIFWPIHQRLGGRMRLFISGGSALPPGALEAFRGLGFNLYEGYGLTEAAPVLTVNRPGGKILAGSVGEPLPGIEVQIAAPDEHGIGEVIASGPNVMLGYYRDPEATSEVLKDGWLYTGDLGRFDEDRRLYIVGRKKEMILGPSGENVYPDELEELYRDSPYIKELSIVGLPEEDGGETVACLIVPEYSPGGKELAREAVQAHVLEHVKSVSAKLPVHKRVKVVHLTDIELPKTATRKVKRKEVTQELAKLERLRQRGEEARREPAGPSASWLHDVLATVSGQPQARIHGAARLEELGFDSLMYTELAVALEAAGVMLPERADLTGVGTVADLGRLVASSKSAKRREPAREARPAASSDADEIRVPETVATLGSAALTWAQRMTYEKLFRTRVTGRAYLPQRANFLVAANHASHLDMGLVKHALGEWGGELVALAAKDYFFGDPIKRAYFENFTNLVPMDRHGSLRESLRLASEVITQGYVLLIFPEGTRSTTGVMVDFKPSLGYLALHNHVDIVPMYLEGTHDALPKGSIWPKHRDIAAHIGPLVTYAELERATRDLGKSEAYREVARLVENAVRRLAPKGSINRRVAERERPRPGAVTAESVMVHSGEEA